MTLVNEQSEIQLRFSLQLESGEVIDDNFSRSPASFKFGDDDLPDNFSKLLLGMEEGERKRFTIPPEEGFGPHRSENVQRFRRDRFPSDISLEEGLVVSFEDAAKGEVPGVVKSIDEQLVEVDFNHPLAGKTLIFTAEIVEVRQ